MKQIIKLLLATILLLLISGCSTTKVYNVNQDIQTQLSDADVKNIIINSAKSLRWQTQEMGAGEIKATLNVRRHQAVVSIRYDRSSYSIGYISSRNLKYSAGKIHKAYNKWVHELQQKINSSLSSATPNFKVNQPSKNGAQITNPAISPSYQDIEAEPVEVEEVSEEVIFI